MPIHVPGVPLPDLHAVVARHLANPLAAPHLSPAQRRNAHATDAFPVYHVGLDELERMEEGLAPPPPRFWRHLLVHQADVVAEVDVRMDTGEPRVVAVHQGPRGPGTARALAEAQGLDLVKNGDFELRMLEAPGIFHAAVWLHGTRDDLLIPVEPDKSALPLYQPTPLGEALPVLRRRIAEVREAVQAAPGPSGA